MNEKPIFPSTPIDGFTVRGISTRELFALGFGLLFAKGGHSSRDSATYAVKYADSLLAELGKDTSGN